VLDAGTPRTQARQPRMHVAPIRLVFAVVFADQCRLLVPPDERRRDDPERGGPGHQGPTSEDERLTQHRDDQPEIHRVTDKSIEPGDHQALGRRNRHGGTAGVDELRERVHRRDEARDDQHDAHDDLPRRRGIRYLPTGYQPRDEAHHRSRSCHKERRRGDRGLRPLHDLFTFHFVVEMSWYGDGVQEGGGERRAGFVHIHFRADGGSHQDVCQQRSRQQLHE
jgi:hypothetical protein